MTARPKMGAVRIERETDPARRAAICRDLLGRLPDWFGIPDAVDDYVETARSRAMAVARDGASTIGFATLEMRSPVAAELHLIAVDPAHHRRGIGRALLSEIEAMARAQGAVMLAVKTLAPSAADPNYAKTRAFYEACGFSALATFPTLWGPDNPCLLMGKSLL